MGEANVKECLEMGYLFMIWRAHASFILVRIYAWRRDGPNNCGKATCPCAKSRQIRLFGRLVASNEKRDPVNSRK